MDYDVTSAVPDVSYTATGSATFTVPFTFIDITHLVVTVNDVVVPYSGNWSTSAQQTTGGGPLTFAVAPTPGAVVRVRRATPIVRVSRYVDGAAMYADVAETDFDWLTCIAQELATVVADLEERLAVAESNVLGIETGEPIEIV